MDTVTSIW